MRNPFKLFSLGLQHVLAMYAGAVVVPLIVADSIGLTGEQTAYLVAIDLLTCGLATLLQVWKNKFFGIGLPVVLGCTFTAVGPMISIGSKFGMGAIYGSIIVSGIVIFLLAPLFGKIIRFFPPVVTGSVVTIIGISLIPVAITDMGGGSNAGDSFGSLSNLALAFGVLILILLLNRFATGFLRSISVLIGLVAGTIAAAFMGKVDFSTVEAASWFHIVKPFYFGTPEFHPSAIITMTLVAIVSVVESTGVFVALGKICDKEMTPADLTKGYRAEGLASILGGIFNAFPYTTFSQNVGLVQMTKVKTRDVIIMAGGILVLLGLLPKVAAATTVIPSPVLGGAMIALFGMVMSSGIRMLSDVDLSNHENLLIIAISVGIGMGVSVMPEIFGKLPERLQVLADSGIVAGSVTAVLLNILFNMTRRSKTAESASEPQDVA
ncbi:nucleobase:cation symporter-2 family protein [Gorillibacterium timonense]|uniref:nucleobase:cation symporter-2 family protein n=1 Tax=Gorillibacterium timonense TaxID=1689269 RepID=UPI00071DA082|nr:nucleobase:cation symporter-2 family protein [Gorillibacterium timonense]